MCRYRWIRFHHARVKRSINTATDLRNSRIEAAELEHLMRNHHHHIARTSLRNGFNGGVFGAFDTTLLFVYSNIEHLNNCEYTDTRQRDPGFCFRSRVHARLRSLFCGADVHTHTRIATCYRKTHTLVYTFISGFQHSLVV